MGWEKEVLCRIGPLPFGSPGLYHLNLAVTAQKDYNRKRSHALKCLDVTSDFPLWLLKIAKKKISFHLI